MACSRPPEPITRIFIAKRLYIRALPAGKAPHENREATSGDRPSIELHLFIFAGASDGPASSNDLIDFPLEDDGNFLAQREVLGELRLFRDQIEEFIAAEFYFHSRHG